MECCCVSSYEYVNGQAVFKMNDFGDQMYAVDKDGNEIYPEKGNPFARDRFGVEHYAKTVDGDETYPRRKKKCVTIRGCKDGNPVVARYASGKQKYPEDEKGNQYYLVDKNGAVFPLRDENGKIYFANTRDRLEIIPIKYFNVAAKKNPEGIYRLGLDSAKNVVYVPLERRRRSIFLSCICMLLMNVPVLLSRLLEYLNS